MQNYLKDNHIYIIAELSANHNQNFQIAKDSVYAAYEAGADAIKLQTYTPDTITLNVKNEYFRANGLWEDKYLYDLYKEAYMPWEWQKDLKEYADTLGIDCFSSPFDFTAVDFLESINVPAYKIASFEINDIALIKYTAAKQKPMIISTGIALEDDIQEAIDACLEVGNHNISLLKCTSAYPALLEEANLNSIKFLKKRFNLPIGFSDHTLGITAPVVAATLGAQIIEKHFILDKNIKSVDSEFSLDKKELAQMVKSLRETEKLLGEEQLILTDKAKESKHYSRSLFVSKDIKKGEIFTCENIKSVRPNLGISTKHYDSILGKKSTTDLKYGIPLKEEHIEDFKR
jgi:pseudaminic acid synthase